MGLTTDVDLDRFAIDGMTPRRHLVARSEGDVVEAIRAANEEGEAVVLWGGGTRMTIGDAPERYDVALDLRELAGIVDHQPADLTVTVRAGTTVAALGSVLAGHGQWWPVEVARPELATVGGTIASAADGPSRFRYLHPRDWAIGVRAVLGDATLTHAGGRVVKNVTGYDLTKLYSGSYGTLCALVEVTLKLLPLPERTITLRADLPELAYAYLIVRELLRERLPLDAVALAIGPAAQEVGAPGWVALFVRLAGNAAAVERLRRAIGSRPLLVEEVEPGIWSRIADLPAGATTSVRGTWPPARPIEPYPLSALWYPGIEIMHLLDDQEGPSLLRELRAAAEGNAGALVLERAPTELRRALGTWGTPRTPPAVAARLRSLFDPRRVLSPGRMP